MAREKGEYLYVENVEGENWFYGHITLEEAQESYEREGLGDDGRDVGTILQHRYVRCVPDPMEDYDVFYRFCKGPAKGAMPVTVVG